MNSHRRISSPVFLCGMMGTGKSAVGKELARLLKQPFTDLDKQIELSLSASVSEIFQTRGERFFREKEQEALSQYIRNNTGVLALGGGTLQDQQIIDRLKSAGILIYINTPIPILLERLQRSNRRPLLHGLTTDQLKQKILQLTSEREIFYSQADIIVEGSRLPAAVTARSIYQKLQNISKE